MIDAAAFRGRIRTGQLFVLDEAGQMAGRHRDVGEALLEHAILQVRAQEAVAHHDEAQLPADGSLLVCTRAASRIPGHHANAALLKDALPLRIDIHIG